MVATFLVCALLTASGGQPAATLGRPVASAAESTAVLGFPQPLAASGPAACLGRPVAVIAPEGGNLRRCSAEAPAATVVRGMSPEMLIVAPEPVAPAGPACGWSWLGDSNGCSRTPRIWFDAEYLLWRVDNAPVPVPLVATGPIGPTAAVLSSGSIDYGDLSGLRLTLGGWFNQDQTFGAQASIFSLERASATQTFAGTPTPFVPVFLQDSGVEGAIPFGSLTQTNTLRLWGFDVDALYNVGRSQGSSVDVLAGFRYLDLTESLTLSGTGGVAPAPASFTDNFGTRNRFYGVDLGARGTYQLGAFDVSGTARVALGVTRQSVSISGTSSANAATGVLAVASNSGQRMENAFGIVPQGNLQVGWSLNNYVRVFAGYDILYWNSVVRPGDQIDRNVNLNPTSTPPAPQPRFQTRDFWAHGLSVGVSLRY